MSVRYSTILADPPWRFKNYSMAERAQRGEQWARRNGRSPYDSMDTEAIAALPVREIAARDCTLLLWVTNPKLPEGLAVMNAWGFTYRTAITWVKMQAVGVPRSGTGYHARGCTELLLIGSRGSPGVPEPAYRPYGVFFCPRTEHSRKPDRQYEIAEGYPGPWVELFCRPRDGMFPPREGWRFLGDAVDGRDMRDALRDLSSAPAPPRAQHTPKTCVEESLT